MPNYLTYPRRSRVPGFIPGIMPCQTIDQNGLLEWFDAASVVANNNDALGTWSDKSGTGRNATQATAGNKPTFKTNILNSLPGVLFATDDYMNITTGTWGTTIGTFYALATITNMYAFFMADGGATTEYWRYNATNTYTGMMRNARLENVPCVFPASGVHVITVVSGVSGYAIYSDRVQIYSGAPSWGIATTQLMGCNQTQNSYFSGYFHEIMFYNTEHTLEQMTARWDYLKSRWGVPA